MAKINSPVTDAVIKFYSKLEIFYRSAMTSKTWKLLPFNSVWQHTELINVNFLLASGALSIMKLTFLYLENELCKVPLTSLDKVPQQVSSLLSSFYFRRVRSTRRPSYPGTSLWRDPMFLVQEWGSGPSCPYNEGPGLVPSPELSLRLLDLQLPPTHQLAGR